ncbi:MAG: methyltransferase domain-containing protein [Leptolyngbyaceae cyanobacterium SM1_1_3]|nr:methyltransferase domain-containing protein [Leptolyngbyaceae cyanobacterium SM1_1_3]NJN04123.1 methyltransferase domain-containing protein [Leptolyngbyaceae cyanobacterium RM1_1_2]NJO09649.1 methyltransferase domain-containing protein [Leptolyngbyaceae cyanobacterium SL_1_1]
MTPDSQHKQQLAGYYSSRSVTYDTESSFHPRLAHHLVEQIRLRPGQQVLDIATGTGLVAIAAARQVGSQGFVLGLDFSDEMLKQAQRKADFLNLENIEFRLADVEAVSLPAEHFDTVFCCSALVLLSDIPVALKCWHTLLRVGGSLAVNGFSEYAFVASMVMHRVAAPYGVSLTAWNYPTGTPERFHQLLAAAGFQNIQITAKQFGGYLSLEDLKKWWRLPSDRPNPFDRPLLALSETQLQQLQREYFAELEAIATPQGVWNDITAYTAICRK